MSNATPGPLTPARARIESVDLLRGIIMVLMALDHVRDYFGDAAASPTNLATTTTALFFTRWVTHICAPVFFLLTGTGAHLALARRGRAGLSRFLASRGAWLILLEITLMRFLWQFNVDYRVTVLTVLWALGWAMIVLAGLVWLPTRVVAAFGLALVLGHNLLDGIRAPSSGALAPLWNVLHQPGFLVLNGHHDVFVAYQLVPWVGVTALGYVLGAAFTRPREERSALFIRLGAALVAAFVVLRALNVYGDPAPWKPQATSWFTVLSFIDTTKYPPSLLFLLMTLGPAIIALGLFERGIPRILRPALIIGTVPLFYYMMHVLVMHTAALVASGIRFGTVRFAIESPGLDKYPMTQPPGWPAPLPVVWLIWIGVVLVLYPMCRWYAAVKRRRTDWWLSYI